MAIKFKTEFLHILFARDLIILLKLLLLCLINKLIPILGQPFLLFIFVRLCYKLNLTLATTMSQPFNHARRKFICHFLGKCLFHEIHTIFKTVTFSALFDGRNNHIHPCSSLKDWQFVKHTGFFPLFHYLTTNFMFCNQNAFTLLSFSTLNFFRDCVIDKQTFGGKIFSFQSLKWPHNG